MTNQIETRTTKLDEDGNLVEKSSSRGFVDNPFFESRVKSKKNQVQIARELDVAPAFIMKVEQGLFRSVPHRLVEHYLTELGLDPNWIHQYRRFQLLTRRSAPRPFNKTRTVMLPEPFDFAEFRELNWSHLTKAGWCRAFCVHPSVLNSIENKMPDRLPYEIEIALLDSGVCNSAEMSKLKLAFAEAKLESKLNKNPATKLIGRASQIVERSNP